MARRRVWRRKSAHEKERRRVMNREKQRPEIGGQMSEVQPARKPADKKISDARIRACYRMLSPMTREVVDNLVAIGLSMEKVINGIRS